MPPTLCLQASLLLVQLRSSVVEGGGAEEAVTTRGITMVKAEGVAVDAAETACHSESIPRMNIAKARRKISVAEAGADEEQMRVAKARGQAEMASSAGKVSAVISTSSRRDATSR